jgi:hypothetical protein
MFKARHRWVKSAGSVVLGVIAAMSVTAGIAFADAPTEAMNTDGYVTSATTPASQPVPEILGISSIEESNGTLDTISYTDWVNAKWSVKYILMGSSEYNTNPNPYFNNVFAGSGKTPVYNKQHDGMLPKVTRPMAALLPYATTTDGGGDQAVWNMLPDIIIGCRTTPDTTTDYSSAEFAPAAAAANGVSNYSPIAIDYNMSTLASIVNNAYLTADAADTVVENSNGTKHLRYGSAMAIVSKYETFVKGSQGYVLKQLKADNAEKKTYAIVTAAADGSYTLLSTPTTWGSNTRIIEALYAVGNNLADSVSGAVTAEQLDQADLIIVTGNDTDTIVNSLEKYKSKMYWVVGGSTNRGQIYHNASNSMDVATHYARIMSCLYPEYLDQSDMVAYFYEQFYHVKTDALAKALDNAMDGVRNWDQSTGENQLEWTESTLADYSTAKVASKLNEGVSYIESLSAEQIGDMGQVAYDLVALNGFYAVQAIEALPDTSAITGSDAEAVKAARAAYDSLSDDQKALVSDENLKKLEDAEKAVADRSGVDGFVYRLYYNVMGRVASDGEIDFQANAITTSGAAQITFNFYNSKEFANKSATMTNEEIVENVYQTMLGRSADEAGLAMWKGYLDNGMSACALAAGFAESQEFANVCAGYGIGTGSADWLRANLLESRDKVPGVTSFVYRLYTIVLNRDAEVAGLNVQCQALIDGTACWEIARNFFDGDEYKNFNKTDTEFVADCYAAMMNREGSSDEHAAWVARMAKEGLTRVDVVKGFCQSDEFEAICQSCGMTSGMR